MRIVKCKLGITLLLVAVPLLMGADWGTHRGNAQRTGSDGTSGPKAGKVLWVHKVKEHFVAAPVPGERGVYVSSLGAFNTARFDALSTEPGASKRVMWSKSAPYLKLPTVSAPAVVGGKLIFGDGMHQTDGAILHCLGADNGLPIWQLTVPGKLVHLEGAPAVADGKVYIGGGNAGVLCVDMNRVTLDGKEQDLAGVQSILDKKWKELLAKYEEEKKTDPDFAVPPSEDALPKPTPKVAWQMGKDQWHVDAAVLVDGGQVFAASAFLDDEKLGDRALHCLNAGDGKPTWKAPLKLNPWAGPSRAGELILVGCSSIRFDPKLIPKGQGELVAVNAADGSIKWKKPVPGGIVSAVAYKDGLAVFTATDGKIRCVDVAKNSEKWSYDAKAPFFAGVAIAGDTVYGADLKGMVHAVSLANGKSLWTLDLANDAAVKAPGSVYGSPIVAGGRLYVATCNLEGDGGRRETAVVCVGEK